MPRSLLGLIDKGGKEGGGVSGCSTAARGRRPSSRGYCPQTLLAAGGLLSDWSLMAPEGLMVAGGLMTAGNPGTAGGLMADQVNAAPSRADDKPMVAALHSVAVAALALSVAASWPFVCVSLS